MALRTIGTLAIAAAAGLALTGCMEGSGRNEAHVAPQIQRTGFGFFVMDEGPSVKLAYGQANSDNVGLMLQCRKGSRAVEITEATGTPKTPRLTLISSGQSANLKSRIESGEGSPVLVATASTTSPPLSAFRRSGGLEVVRSDGRYPLKATADERAGIEGFFAACERG